MPRMKIGLILFLGIVGFLLLGPVGMICGVVIGATASINSAIGSANKDSNKPKPDNPDLQSAMRKIREEGEARRAAKRQDQSD